MMKKTLCAVLVVVLMVGSYIMGGLSALRSEGWINFDRDTFVVEWAGNYWEWNISEE